MNRLAIILGYGEDLKDNAMLFAMQLVVVTLPFVEHINSWAIIIMTFVWLFTVNFSNFSFAFRERKLSIYFLLYFVWLVIGLIYTDDMASGLKDLTLKLSFVIFPFVLLFNKRINQHFLRGVVRVFYYTMFIASIYMLVAAWISFLSNDSTGLTDSLSYFTYEKFASTLSIQPIYLSMYMVFSFFAVIWDFFIDPRIGLTRSGKIMAQIWAFHFYMMVILLSSRMELLVLLFISFLGIAYYDGFKRKSKSKAAVKMVILLSVTILFLGIIPINKARYTEMVDINQDYKQNQWGGRSIRIHKWLNALELIADQPLLGTGTGDMQEELEKVYKKNNFDLALEHKFNPHNQYLQTWASTGLIGLFFLLGIFIVSLIYALNSRNALYIGLVLLLSLSMLTESMLERQKGLVFFSFFLLFFGGYYFNHKEKISLHPKE